MAQVSNLSPFSVEVPAALEIAFTQADSDLVVAQGSTQALLDTFTALGGTLGYMSRPNKDSSPEARHGYAMWTRLCVGKAARMLGVEPSAFEPIYSGAVSASDRVEIGGESKTVTAWKGFVSNAGRMVKVAMQRLVADQLAEAKLDLSYAEKARADAKAEAEKAEAAVASAQAVAAKAEADAIKAEADAANAPRGAKAQAKAKAAKLRVKADSLIGEATALLSAADDAFETERAAMLEVKSEAARVEALRAQLPSKGRGAVTPKTDAEKWAGRVDALLKDVRSAASPTGDVDAAALVAALVEARKAITIADVTE